MKIPPRPGPGWRFNAPPGWPPTPDGWEPTEGWGGPDPSWPSAPPYWSWWVEEYDGEVPASGFATTALPGADPAPGREPGPAPGSGPHAAPPVPALVLPPRRIRVKPSYIGAGMAAVLVAVLLAGVLAMASATKSREATSAGEEVSATMNDDPNITVVVDKDFQPATTRTEIVYVDGECLTLSSWGNCYQRRQVPVHQRVPVPEQYYLVIRKGTTGQSRMVVDAFSYRSCAPGDEWPACRDGG